MARITTVLEDVNGSFARFLRTAPKEFRQELAHVVKQTVFGVGQRMKANAPVGPDAPHIRNDVETTARGLGGKVGYLTNPDQAAVALYNEFRPNKQPFMRKSAEDEAGEFRARATKALQKAGRSLSSGLT